MVWHATDNESCSFCQSWGWIKKSKWETDVWLPIFTFLPMILIYSVGNFSASGSGIVSWADVLKTLNHSPRSLLVMKNFPDQIIMRRPCGAFRPILTALDKGLNLKPFMGIPSDCIRISSSKNLAQCRA